MSSLSLIQTIAVWILPVLFAITIHEAAHAFVANLCGDSTAKMLNRLSFNPLRHIDLIGTILVPIVVATLSHFQFVFGWAKPVPINWHHLHHPRRDMALVAIAGPAVNIFMALLWSMCAKLGAILGVDASGVALFLFLSGSAGVWINLILAFLNLIPIPPLDGSRVAASIMPASLLKYYAMIEPFGFFILLALLFTNILNQILLVPVLWSIHLINSLFFL